MPGRTGNDHAATGARQLISSSDAPKSGARQVNAPLIGALSFERSPRLCSECKAKDKPTDSLDYYRAIYARRSSYCAIMLTHDDPAHVRRKTSIPPLLHTKIHSRGAGRRALCRSQKRNNMFSNWIYRGMPTVVLLLVAGVVEFMAIRAFV